MNMGRGGYRRQAGRKAGWRHGTTQTIRVPIALTEEILEIGKQLDRGEYIRHRRYFELKTILSEWEAKCNAQPIESQEWQKVRQLLDEIQQVLSKQEAKTATDKCRSQEEVLGHNRDRGHSRGHDRDPRKRWGRRSRRFGRDEDCGRDFQSDME